MSTDNATRLPGESPWAHAKRIAMWDEEHDGGPTSPPSEPPPTGLSEADLACLRRQTRGSTGWLPSSREIVRSRFATLLEEALAGLDGHPDLGALDPTDRAAVLTAAGRRGAL